MKFPLFFAVFSWCLAATFSLRADDLVVLKVTETDASSEYHELDPGTPAASGKAVLSSTVITTSYLVIDMTTAQYVRVSYGTVGAATKVKTFSFAAALPLSGLFAPFQPLKGAGGLLWNFKDGGTVNQVLDLDGDTVPDGQSTRFFTRYYNGPGTPLVVSKTRTLPNVPRSIAGKEVYTFVENDSVDDQDHNPHRLFRKGAVTIAMTLDTATTTAANLTALTPSAAAAADLALTPGASLADSTLNNALARVHAALYALGYRKGTI